MKHLKRFNEELDPATYISAGTKLKYKGHEERGKNLVDHGTSKLPKLEEYTFFIKRNSNVTKTTGKWDYSKKSFVCANNIRLYASVNGLGSRDYNYSVSAFVKTRKEALEIFNLIKSTSPELISSKESDEDISPKLTVNSLYRDGIEELYNKSQEESSSKSKEEMLKGITSPNDKPKNFYHKHIKPFFKPFFQSDDVDKSIPSKGIPPKA